MAGVTTTGFEGKDLDTILTEIEAAEKNALGQSLNIRPTSVVGQINGVFSAKIAEVWEVAQEVYASQYPDTAVGVSLDQLCQLTGVLRLAATKSTVSLSCIGTSGTDLPAGRSVKNTSTGTYWTNPLSGTIPAGGTATITFESVEYGPVVGLASTLTTIDSPVSGWSTVTNALDADEGRDIETDAALRLRRAALLTAQGKGTVDAIQADVLAVADVLAAIVFENTTLVTDGDGVPGKAFEAVVIGGTATALAQAIWDSKPAGISAYGATTGTATDTLGGSRVMAFTRPTELTVYLSLTAITGTGWGGATADIASSLITYGDTLSIGDDVYRARLYDPVFDVSGVDDVTQLYLGLSAAPAATANIGVGTRQLAAFDTSRVVVTLI